LVVPHPDFASRFRSLREERGLSQSQLAFAMYDADTEERRGYDASFIARVERGDRRPPYRFMLLAGRALAPTLAELPEYFLAMARRELDEEQVGLENALIALARFDPEIDQEVGAAVIAAVRKASDIAAADAGDRPRTTETTPSKRSAKASRSGGD
jgi:transcriptional regulator with XRE-family HTH domain